jgi:hypothetical protein
LADKFSNLSSDLSTWIEQQHVFFVATAAATGHINLSPKGQDSLSVVSPTEIVWLNLTGSGNESAAHILDTNRMTLMWCAFDGPPQILRVYGTVETIHPRDAAWQACTKLISAPLGARQYFKLNIDLVQTSCGYAVPNMDYVDDREALTKWSDKRGESGIAAYWEEQNQTSIDGLPTKILGP